VSKNVVIYLHYRRRGQYIFESRGLALVYPGLIPYAQLIETIFRQRLDPPCHSQIVAHPKSL